MAPPTTGVRESGGLAPVEDVLVAAGGPQRGQVVSEATFGRGVGPGVVVDDDDQRQVLLAAMLLRASHAMPPVNAPSPITATVCRSVSPRSRRALAIPSAHDRAVEAWEFSTTS
jgi:hypothetical protein